MDPGENMSTVTLWHTAFIVVATAIACTVGANWPNSLPVMGAIVTAGGVQVYFMRSLNTKYVDLLRLNYNKGKTDARQEIEDAKIAAFFGPAVPPVGTNGGN